ncbi:hypothetical protein BJY16_005306 [Actinoplanes octamycinicus]|uniref:Polyketide cyclase/dehydrase/lipid transport protein n=1 Tax=Actinoplanes octamycinicus TaxID=135948 RepID=A0A7W7H154_9ACTN|nr:hypothetical protein [Actinoplanes octamycinicus]MBB4741847.1 hypothetical protein [Actinoplanes octamycinicus]GIE60611.1 hypothetical protein Aoc01nite_60130 [Actinoplanes octamycinicus]
MTGADPGPVLSEHRGVVAAPIGRVRELVLAVSAGEFSGAEVPLVLGDQGDRRVTVTGGPQVLRASVASARVTIEVDREAGWVQARGEWWWCGRFQLAEGADGHTVIHQRTFNLATGPAGRLVPFTVGRTHRQSGKQSLRRLLDDLGTRLNCQTRMLPPTADR